jgi:hypothetical protein
MKKEFLVKKGITAKPFKNIAEPVNSFFDGASLKIMTNNESFQESPGQ